ncbi:MAG: hypothetical protein A2381_10690 [Bdellovibrionales bacterium RIFOXYB1_FULL_37_110]|nr:MAG: hypothetical protein A2181_06830 [Bdellovibrionales bacterium RIFOXYA1_FULL_38_20]OFZ51132.1 MAG: hypothetical protein A2417_17670 [Bdellovibrionales bacterium RIFOXYC1_FULL_37_79]OFZ52721.1 MAG: hypothetical protein A2328_08235 [Bdellovibrionales bacterium RIFOXYB2_FULL_36_6]OFZ61239.1 MAG: hypothetical protein A2381_10690 [Bdellovibrionales bacterium RIFOXYB1_FULL_37_110]OFZ62102.1 MAG: hypothetical protein A2577_14265 [Bdellovibrionales bacterium RIFOXYD1_FULL_36_51]
MSQTIIFILFIFFINIIHIEAVCIKREFTDDEKRLIDDKLTGALVMMQVKTGVGVDDKAKKYILKKLNEVLDEGFDLTNSNVEFEWIKSSEKMSCFAGHCPVDTFFNISQNGKKVCFPCVIEEKKYWGIICSEHEEKVDTSAPREQGKLSSSDAGDRLSNDSKSSATGPK